MESSESESSERESNISELPQGSEVSNSNSNEDGDEQKNYYDFVDEGSSQNSMECSEASEIPYQQDQESLHSDNSAVNSTDSNPSPPQLSPVHSIGSVVRVSRARACKLNKCYCDWDSSTSSSYTTGDERDQIPPEKSDKIKDRTSTIQSDSIKANQLCTFCAIRFVTEEDLSSHLDECNPYIKRVIKIDARHCLVCNKRLPQFSLCGLIRHAGLCLIAKRETFVRQSQPVKNSSDIGNKIETDAPSSVPKKRGKRRHSPKQIAVLNHFFSVKQTISKEEKHYLADKTRLTVMQVQQWFKHRRTSLRSKPNSNSKLNRLVQTARRKYGLWLKEWQYTILKHSYETNPNLDLKRKQMIANRTGISLRQVTTWLYNQRKNVSSWSKFQETKDKKEDLKLKLEPPSTIKMFGITVLQILEDYFKRNSNPNLAEILDLANVTTLEMKLIRNWFARKRTANRAKSVKVDCAEDDDEDDQNVREDKDSSSLTSTASEVHLAQIKDMTSRKKFATLKRMGITNFQNVFEACEPLVSKLFVMFNEDTKQQPMLRTLINETELLAPIFELNNPFNANQIAEMEELQSKFLESILQLRISSNWMAQLKTFGFPRVLKVWVPVLFYSEILKVPLENAVRELYHLSLRRTETLKLQDWLVPQLLDASNC